MIDPLVILGSILLRIFNTLICKQMNSRCSKRWRACPQVAYALVKSTSS